MLEYNPDGKTRYVYGFPLQIYLQTILRFANLFATLSLKPEINPVRSYADGHPAPNDTASV